MEEELSRILASHKGQRTELIAILLDVQEEFGYLPKEAILVISSFLKISVGAIYSIATFYNQFRFVPPGKHPIKVCMGTACHMVGGSLVLDAAQRELEIKVGEVTEDLEFSLDRVACVGCCSLAPVVVIGDTVHARVSPFKLEEILTVLKQKKHQDGDSQE